MDWVADVTSSSLSMLKSSSGAKRGGTGVVKIGSLESERRRRRSSILAVVRKGKSCAAVFPSSSLSSSLWWLTWRLVTSVCFWESWLLSQLQITQENVWCRQLPLEQHYLHSHRSMSCFQPPRCRSVPQSARIDCRPGLLREKYFGLLLQML